MKDWFVKFALEVLESLLGPERVQTLIKQMRKAVIQYLEALAKQTENEIDDKIVAIIKKAFELEDQKLK